MAGGTKLSGIEFAGKRRAGTALLHHGSQRLHGWCSEAFAKRRVVVKSKEPSSREGSFLIGLFGCEPVTKRFRISAPKG